MVIKHLPLLMAAGVSAQIGGGIIASPILTVVGITIGGSGGGAVPDPTNVAGLTSILGETSALGDIPVGTSVIGVITSALGGDIPVPTSVIDELTSLLPTSVVGEVTGLLPTSVIGEVTGLLPTSVLEQLTNALPTSLIGEVTSLLGNPTDVPGAVITAITSLIGAGTDPGAIVSDITSILGSDASQIAGDLPGAVGSLTSALGDNTIIDELTSIIGQVTSVILGGDATTTGGSVSTTPTATSVATTSSLSATSSLPTTSGTILTSVSVGLNGTTSLISTASSTRFPVPLNATSTGFFNTSSAVSFTGTTTSTISVPTSTNSVPDVTNPIIGTTMTSLTATATPTQTAGASVPAPLLNNTAFSYQGCYAAFILGTPALDMGSFFQRGDLTIEMCGSMCQGENVFGLIAGEACFCGENIGATKIDDEICAVPCEGDNSQSCGGFTEFSIYSFRNRATLSQRRQEPRARTDPETTSSAAEVRFVYNGCYNLVEDSANAAPAPADGIYENSLQLTPDTCATYCEGYSYFGLYFGESCICANDLGARTQVPLQDTPSFCNVECTGANDTICGGGSHLSVYSRVERDLPAVSSGIPATVTAVIGGSAETSTVTTTITVGAGNGAQVPATVTSTIVFPAQTVYLNPDGSVPADGGPKPVTTTVYAATQTIYLNPDGTIAGTSSGGSGSGAYGSGSGAYGSGSGTYGSGSGAVAPGSGAGSAPLPTVTVTVNQC